MQNRRLSQAEAQVDLHLQNGTNKNMLLRVLLMSGNKVAVERLLNLDPEVLGCILNPEMRTEMDVNRLIREHFQAGREGVSQVPALLTQDGVDFAKVADFYIGAYNLTSMTEAIRLLASLNLPKDSPAQFSLAQAFLSVLPKAPMQPVNISADSVAKQSKEEKPAMRRNY